VVAGRWRATLPSHQANGGLAGIEANFGWETRAAWRTEPGRNAVSVL
jgi:hypothetical protein